MCQKVNSIVLSEVITAYTAYNRTISNYKLGSTFASHRMSELLQVVT